MSHASHADDVDVQLVEEVSSAHQPKSEDPPPDQGYHEIHDDQGNLVCAAFYKDKKLHGEYRTYEGGVLKQKAHYTEGKLDGPVESFEDGRLLTYMWYKDNTPEGVTVTYASSGVIQSHGLHKKGRLDGAFLTYSEEGKLAQYVTYVDGLKHGPTVFYYPSGMVLSHGQFVQDKEEGVFQKYYSSGVPMEWCRYKAGIIIEGPFMYDEKGKLVTKEKGRA